MCNIVVHFAHAARTMPLSVNKSFVVFNPPPSSCVAPSASLNRAMFYINSRLLNTHQRFTFVLLFSVEFAFVRNYHDSCLIAWYTKSEYFSFFFSIIKLFVSHSSFLFFFFASFLILPCFSHFLCRILPLHCYLDSLLFVYGRFFHVSGGDDSMSVFILDAAHSANNKCLIIQNNHIASDFVYRSDMLFIL